MPFKSPTTIQSYALNFSAYINPALGKVELQNLTALQIQQFFNRLAEKSPCSDRKLKPKTLRNVYMNFNAMLKKAVELELLKKNPAENIELPQCKKYQAEVFDAAELQKLIELIRGTDIEVAIMILVSLGLRRGELLGLKWEHIDFENGIVSIENNVVPVKGKTISKAPKSASGLRKIDAPDILMELLRRERKVYIKRKLLYGADFNDTGLVCSKPDGSPYHTDYYAKKFKELIKKNGLKTIRLHDLRHTNATFMLKLGVPVKVMQGRLGHSTFGTTMDTYTHTVDEMRRDAAEKLNEGLRKII
jgi:integrase